MLAHLRCEVMQVALYRRIFELTLVGSQTRRPILRKWSAIATAGKTCAIRTFRSPSREIIDVLTPSSVNSGNSFKQSRNVITSSASPCSWSGKSSASKSSRMAGLAACTLFAFRRGRTAGFMTPSRGCLYTFLGNRSASFSRKRNRIWASRSRK